MYTFVIGGLIFGNISTTPIKDLNITFDVTTSLKQLSFSGVIHNEFLQFNQFQIQQESKDAYYVEWDVILDSKKGLDTKLGQRNKHMYEYVFENKDSRFGTKNTLDVSDKTQRRESIGNNLSLELKGILKLGKNQLQTAYITIKDIRHPIEINYDLIETDTTLDLNVNANIDYLKFNTKYIKKFGVGVKTPIKVMGTMTLLKKEL